MKMNFKKSIYYFGFCALTMAIIIPFNIASAGRRLGKQRHNRYHSWSVAETNRLLEIMLNYARSKKNLFKTKGETKRFPNTFWDGILNKVKKDEIFDKNNIRRTSISSHFYNILKKAKISNGINFFMKVVFNDNITRISYDGKNITEIACDGENINYNNGDESEITNEPKGGTQEENNNSPKKPYEFTAEDCKLLCNNLLKLLENPGEINIIDIIIRKDYTSSQ